MKNSLLFFSVFIASSFANYCGLLNNYPSPTCFSLNLISDAPTQCSIHTKLCNYRYYNTCINIESNLLPDGDFLKPHFKGVEFYENELKYQCEKCRRIFIVTVQCDWCKFEFFCWKGCTAELASRLFSVPPTKHKVFEQSSVVKHMNASFKCECYRKNYQNIGDYYSERFCTQIYSKDCGNVSKLVQNLPLEKVVQIRKCVVHTFIGHIKLILKTIMKSHENPEKKPFLFLQRCKRVGNFSSANFQKRGSKIIHFGTLISVGIQEECWTRYSFKAQHFEYFSKNLVLADKDRHIGDYPIRSFYTSVNSHEDFNVTITFDWNGDYNEPRCAAWDEVNFAWNELSCFPSDKIRLLKHRGLYKFQCNCEWRMLQYSTLLQTYIYNMPLFTVSTSIFPNITKISKMLKKNTNENRTRHFLDNIKTILKKHEEKNVSFEDLSSVANVLDRLLPTVTKQNTKANNFGRDYLELIDKTTALLRPPADGIVEANQHLVLGSISKSVATNATFFVPRHGTLKDTKLLPRKPTDAVELSITIDTSRIIGNRMDFSLLSDSQLFTSIHRQVYGSAQRNAYVVSSVIAARAQLSIGSKDDYPVRLTFHHNFSDGSLLHCAFWDNKTSTWKLEGCSTSRSSGQQIDCRCTHLTNFALLFARRVKPNKFLQALSYFCLVVSCMALIFTIAANAAHLKHITRLNRQNHQRAPTLRAGGILLSLCSSLLGGHLVFFVAGSFQGSRAACKVVGVLLHFFYLSVFFWSLAEGLNIFFSFIFIAISRNRLSVNVSRPVLKTSLFAWGTPVLIILVNLIVNRTNNYGSTAKDGDRNIKGLCFLTHDLSFLVTFVAPFSVCLFINIIILIALAVMLRRFDSLSLSNNNRKKWKKRALGFLGVCIVLNLTWIFGLWLLVKADEALMFVFVLVNGLQGLFIFLFYCIVKSDVRQFIWSNLCRQHRYNERTTSTESSHGGSRRGRGSGDTKTKTSLL